MTDTVLEGLERRLDELGRDQDELEQVVHEMSRLVREVSKTVSFLAEASLGVSASAPEKPHLRLIPLVDD